MSIVENKKAFHDYFIEQRYEAGMVLEGWEVKAVRAGRAQLKEAYVIVQGDAQPGIDTLLVCKHHTNLFLFSWYSLFFC